MTSNRPYLIRAFYEWIVDNDCTPYVVVDAYHSGVSVPQDYVSDGQIVLNLAPRATTGLEMTNQGISFSTRFGGVPTSIYLPVSAVMGIYARENGQGMVFQEEKLPEPARPMPVKVPPLDPEKKKDKSDDNPDKPTPPTGSGKTRPSLKVIK
ncbi:MAG: ClpXP protease specificity-enhancing factor [Pseudomonadales bacterium]|nr:ClpXP protease specificity-enhancing factor [Pseudomonadales bacterium]MCP5172578.1 ClpXP protease specificity-enhancing factor [Pseudomonadales bacterium]MCP5303147.1 ClpXP protease specificity-enhancing factor [Pseudomonadales bacterium]